MIEKCYENDVCVGKIQLNGLTTLQLTESFHYCLENSLSLPRESCASRFLNVEVKVVPSGEIFLVLPVYTFFLFNFSKNLNKR